MENQQQVQQPEKPRKPIWKRWWFWVIAIFIIIIIASAGGSEKKESKTEVTSPVQEKTVQPQPEATWQKVKSWQGTGIKNTEPFIITGKQWRVVWSFEDTTGFGGSMVQIFVYRTGEELFSDLLANATGTASDTSYIYKSGEFYLQINSANGNWAITVEELK